MAKGNHEHAANARDQDAALLPDAKLERWG